jgi:endo-1,4-beta-xylanase
MNRKKKVISLIITLLLVLSLSGCSHKDRQTVDTSANGVEKNETTLNAEDKTAENEASEKNETSEKIESEKQEEIDTVEVANSTENNTLTNNDVKENKEPVITYEEIYSDNFENGSTKFISRGSESTSIVTSQAYEGSKSLESSSRTQTWNGPKVDLSEFLTDGKRIKVSAWLKYDDGAAASLRIYSKIEKNASEYLDLASVMVKKGEWTLLEGETIIPNGTSSAALYFETEYKTAYTKDDLVNIYLDNVVVTEVKVDIEPQTLPALKDFYKDYFSFGVAVGGYDLTSKEKASLITSQFNSMTMGNEMKPENVLDYNACISDLDKTNEEPALHFDRLEIGLKFAKENKLAMRGHTLVWHSQTPSWFFKEDYSKALDAPLVSKEIMLKRLESYIKQVLTYTQDNYPGIIYAWDVVNEAILPSDGEENGYRVKDSLWYQTIGPDYVEKAFEYARKYADPNVALFYNDYNTYETDKRIAIYNLATKLKEKGIIDGIGMQSHIKIDYPSLVDYESTIKKFAELNLQIQLTELDMDMETNTEDDFTKQAMRFKRMFTMLRKLVDEDKANITNVTFWGITDEGSWLNDATPSYPLLFDKYLQPKKAFWAVLLDDSIPLY